MNSDTPVTRWTVIRDAAAGDAAARKVFAECYEPVVRAYFEARWRGRSTSIDADDAVQDVFLDCFRENGALGRADSAAPGGFRAYLHGIVRNVARRAEERRRVESARGTNDVPDDVEGRERTASQLFERAWAQSIVSQASALLADRARREGEPSVSRVELLRLRFEDDLPIREIARRRGVPAAGLHRDYARARRDFQDALRDVVRRHGGGEAGDLERECARVLDAFR